MSKKSWYNIETIKSRLKSTESIIEKMEQKNLPLSVDNIGQEINDIASVREIENELYEYAQISADLDLRMEQIYKQTERTTVHSGICG